MTVKNHSVRFLSKFYLNAHALQWRFFSGDQIPGWKKNNHSIFTLKIDYHTTYEETEVLIDVIWLKMIRWLLVWVASACMEKKD